jgi:hypothetical protein
MEQSPSWEAESRSANQEIPALSGTEHSLPCSQEPATGPILSLMYAVCVHVFKYAHYLINILILSSYLRLDFLSGLFLQDFWLKFNWIITKNLVDIYIYIYI